MRPIFFLDQGETLGGAERFLLDFFEILSAREIEKLSPILVGGKNPQYREILRREIPVEKFDFPSVGGGIFQKILAIFKIFSAARKLKKLAKKNGARVFFSNTPRTAFVIFIAKKFFRLRGKWICFFHDFTVRPRFLLRAICSSAEILCANSVATRNFLRKKIAKKNFSKIKIIENGLDFSKIPQFSPPKKIEKILILGRIDPRKGQFFAAAAAEILREKKFNFFVVGQNFAADPRTVEYEKKIRDFCAEKNLQNFHFLPAIKNPFDAIGDADAVLLLPTEPETFGRVAIEALAANKLVIAFDEIGPAEILRSFENFCADGKFKIEFTFRCEKSARALAKKILFFAENPQNLQFCKLGRDFCEQNFSIFETKKRMRAILEK